MSRRDIDAMHEKRMRAQFRFSVVKWLTGVIIAIAMFCPQVFCWVKLFVLDIVNGIKNLFNKILGLFKK